MYNHYMKDNPGNVRVRRLKRDGAHAFALAAKGEQMHHRPSIANGQHVCAHGLCKLQQGAFGGGATTDDGPCVCRCDMMYEVDTATVQQTTTMCDVHEYRQLATHHARGQRPAARCC